MPAHLETMLYTPNPARCTRFCQSQLDLRPLGTPGDNMAALFAQWRAKVYTEMPEERKPFH
ncbi:MAG: hypothetical protein RIB58_12315 [Phycisphaerales bacterium]|jgi:hypothetical protein